MSFAHADGHCHLMRCMLSDGVLQQVVERSNARQRKITWQSRRTYTDPEMAKEFIERTNVDALAIGFGTAHGIYTEKPVLDLNRIALIKSAKDIPYVMHGGSGLSEEEYRTAIHNGIRKINYYTYLSLAGGRGVMQYLEDKKDKDAIYFEDIAKAGITAMKADVKRAMKIFESDGKI